MGAGTIIAWTDFTFNLAWGCTPVSPGCRNCYAKRLSERYGWAHVWKGRASERRTFGAGYWDQPRKWNAQAEREGRRLKVFCSSMCDNWEDHPTIAAERAKLWPLIRETPLLEWQLLTKRVDRVANSLPGDWGSGYPNVWLGTSIESNEYAWRAETLAAIPAVLRFVSYEPALGPLDGIKLAGIDWVIYGGESGPKYREHDVDWARAMRGRCEAGDLPFFYKQSAATKPEMGIELDGELVREFPSERPA